MAAAAVVVEGCSGAADSLVVGDVDGAEREACWGGTAALVPLASGFRRLPSPAASSVSLPLFPSFTGCGAAEEGFFSHAETFGGAAGDWKECTATPYAASSSWSSPNAAGSIDANPAVAARSFSFPPGGLSARKTCGGGFTLSRTGSFGLYDGAAQPSDVSVSPPWSSASLPFLHFCSARACPVAVDAGGLAKPWRAAASPGVSSSNGARVGEKEEEGEEESIDVGEYTKPATPRLPGPHSRCDDVEEEVVVVE